MTGRAAPAIEALGILPPCDGDRIRRDESLVTVHFGNSADGLSGVRHALGHHVIPGVEDHCAH
ncbi:hypothetical protein [Corynebacterium uberis]|uniref:hypothetical protein n=1 Tax=Corynebacterium uberis TaxID=2883169 RepID=UPI001D09AD13|nr:hypothetical protein [Corynebacterium uberis]UDL75535.1 hypothetical protein LH393_09935 [Corynebacterium uberis]